MRNGYDLPAHDRGSPAELAMTPRVAFVSAHAEYGGEERYIEVMLPMLGPEWVAGVIALADGPHLDRVAAMGFHTEAEETGSRLGMLATAEKLRRRLRWMSPDVVHANGVKAALICALASLGAPWKLIWVKHDLAWDGPLARLIASRCDRVVGVSETAVRFFKRRGERIRVVQNGVAIGDVDRGAAREWLGDVAGDATGALICNAGRICPEKGQWALIEIAPAVLESRPGTRFLMLGKEDSYHAGYEMELRDRAEELGVGAQIRWMGQLEPSEAIRAIAGSDILVAPSAHHEGNGWSEGFGRAIVEAMWVGTPVVAYANGSLPETLGSCGTLIPEGDMAELATAIISLLGDDDELARLASCGQSRARERFRFERTVDEMKAIYVEVSAQP